MLAGFAMLAVMLFVPAGTWQFYQAWVMLGVLFVPMAIMGAVMLVKNPELLSKRLNAMVVSDYAAVYSDHSC